MSRSAQSRAYPSLETATHCLSCSTIQKIRRSLQWSVGILHHSGLATFLSRMLISRLLIRRSVTAAALVRVAPVFLSLFSNLPTRVVTMPHKPTSLIGILTSIPRVDSLSVVLLGSGGKHLLLMGEYIHQFITVFLVWPALTVFPVTANAPPHRTVNFYGAIPGGISFAIPQGTLSTTNDTGTGFEWTVDITGGTNVLLVGGDARGLGSGGSAPFTISYSGNTSCINSTSPSSTAGSPAGGTYPTSTSSGSSGSTGSGNHSS
jgi:hypothetical protein